MASYRNWQVTVVICTALLTVALGQSDAIDFLHPNSGPLDQMFGAYTGETAVTFECSVAGHPKPEILWMRNDSLVPENSKYQIREDGALVIHNPERSDHGDFFWCKAQNAFGALRSRPATLEIAYVEPAGFENLRQSDCLANKGYCIPCNPPNAYPGIKAQWRKDSQRIAPNQRKMILTDGRLCFAFITRADAGLYECKVANSYDQGQLLSYDRTVSIEMSVTRSGQDQPLLKVTAVPTNVTVRQGEEAVLQCVFWGKPVPTLNWARVDGRSIGGAWSLNGYQLKIPNAQANDSGEYTCTALKGSSRKTVTQYLTVNSPPVLTTELENTEVNRESSVSFRCESGNPSDEYSWYYNAEPITFTNRIQRKEPGNSIHIKRAVSRDAGIYQCSVSNMFGTVFSTAQLRVNRGYVVDTSTGRPSVTTTKQVVPDATVVSASALARVVTTTLQEAIDNRDNEPEDNEPGEREGSDGNSAVTLTSSTGWLLIGMVLVYWW